jgi:hypothetical protein
MQIYPKNLVEEDWRRTTQAKTQSKRVVMTRTTAIQTRKEAEDERRKKSRRVVIATLRARRSGWDERRDQGLLRV